MVAQMTVPTAAELRAWLESFVTTEARIAASVALVVVGLVVVVVLPILLTRTERTLVARFTSGRMGDAVSLAREYVPKTVGDLFLRGVQLVIFGTTLTAVMVVWGLTGYVESLVTWLLQSVPLLGKLGGTFVVLLGTYVGYRILGDSVARFGEETTWMTQHQQEILLRMSQLVLFSMSTLLVLTVWQANLSGLLVGAGFLGIVVGFAARQTLGSIIAGFLLMFSRPFTIGDWVEIGDHEGVVTDITIVHTRLENFDGESVVIPNDRVSDRPITNRTNHGGLRLKRDVGIDYDADPGRAEEVALAAMKAVDLVEDAPPPQVIPKSFGDSAIVLELRFWINNPSPPRKWQAIAGVVRAVKLAFDEEGIEIPFPQRTLSNRPGAEDVSVDGVDGAVKSADGQQPGDAS